LAGKLRNDLWTPAIIRRAEKILGECSTLTEAASRISIELKRPTGSTPLTLLFQRRGLPHPLTYLRTADPVHRALHVDSQTRLKREHADLTSRLLEAEARQEVLDKLSSPIAPYEIKRREKKSGLREATAVAMASDWHVEEYVPQRADTGGNFYDLSVAEKRCRRFFDGLLWLLAFNRGAFAIRSLLLWLGGDLMTGYLRNENREENELSPVETVNVLRTWLIAGIDLLLKDPELAEIVIPCSHGNHGRTTELRQISTGAKNSFEWLLYQMLSAHYGPSHPQHTRVKFITDQSNHQYVKVYDFDLHFTHGDEVKFQGGVGGIAVPLMKAVSGWDQVRRCHYHHLGHFHQYTDYGSATVNGSLIGYNQYAMSIRAFPEPPQQAFYILDSKRGKTCKSPIWVGE
jgi:hypothetical protein